MKELREIEIRIFREHWARSRSVPEAYRGNSRSGTRQFSDLKKRPSLNKMG